MRDDLPLLGFGLPVSGAWSTPGTMIRVAQRAEELGYAALWTFQRMLTPVADTNPSYAAVHDPLVTLAFVAGHTERIGLGTATICAPFTPPALLAKAMTSLDHLSAGRLTVGLGMGWMPEEYAAAGVPFSRRGARMEEYLRCLSALWTDDPVEFAGEFYTVPRSRAGLTPVQQPHPPVLLGGAAPAALRRAGRLAQGWIGSTQQDLATITESIEHVRHGAREAGRDEGALRILLRGVVDLVERDPGPGRRPLHGTRDQVVDDLAVLRSQGVTEVFVDLNFSPAVVSPAVVSPAVVSPDVGEEQAQAEAERVLDALAPVHLGST